MPVTLGTQRQEDRKFTEKLNEQRARDGSKMVPGRLELREVTLAIHIIYSNHLCVLLRWLPADLTMNFKAMSIREDLN